MTDAIYDKTGNKPKVQFYLLHPMNHWEILGESDPLAAQIRAGEIKTVNVINLGPSLPEAPGEGRFFAILGNPSGEDQWREITHAVKGASAT